MTGQPPTPAPWSAAFRPRVRPLADNEGERERRGSFAGSLLLHAAAIGAVLWLQATLGPLLDASVKAGGLLPGVGGGGGGGQGDIAYIDLYAATPPAPPAVDQSELTVPPPPEITPPEALTMPQLDLIAKPQLAPMIVRAPSLGGSGGGRGTGTGPGTGSGIGPGSGSGTGGGSGSGTGPGNGPGGGRVTPASPRVLLLPPTAPGSVKGLSVTLRLAVDSAGTVRDVEIVPPTGDGKFNAALKKTALGWRFRPALDAGQPVASLFEVKLSF